MKSTIRNEETKDIEQVQEIVHAAFPTDVESQLVDTLRTNGKAIISLVAVEEERVLGHILFSLVSTSPPNESRGLGLAPVVVQPDVQSQGVGSTLICEGLRRCRELGYDYCVVLGDPNYYGRFGFEKASQFGLRNEYGLDAEFMVIHLSERELPHGLVRYAPEFALFSV
jgi:putative acetyltransferase